MTHPLALVTDLTWLSIPIAPSRVRMNQWRSRRKPKTAPRTPSIGIKGPAPTQLFPDPAGTVKTELLSNPNKTRHNANHPPGGSTSDNANALLTVQSAELADNPRRSGISAVSQRFACRLPVIRRISKVRITAPMMAMKMLMMRPC